MIWIQIDLMQSRSAGNYMDTDQFDASPNLWEMIWIRINLLRVQICRK